MKEYLAQRLQERSAPEEGTLGGRHLVREILQAKILSSLLRHGAMIPIAFHGGTALRFLFSLDRFSEDLDFALEREGRGYDFRSYLRSIRSDFEREGYLVEIKANDRKVVHSAFIRFPGLLHELGLSPHRTEILAIKIEVDTRPPAGAGLETSLVRRHETLRLQHHDRASLFAGKIHAVLQRTYTKGRDFYDLLWYLADPQWPEPNLTMLNNALAQSGWQKPPLDKESWRDALNQRIGELDWQKVVDDVRPFVESASGIKLLTQESILQALRRSA